MSLTETINDAEVTYGPYDLARLADVRSPDTKDSPGTRLLGRVLDYANGADAEPLLESIREFVDEGNDAEEYTVNDLPEDVRDSMSEWADSCVQIYTYQCWQEFVDLCLYEEDIRDLVVPEEGDLTKIAMAAQYVVADRLLGVLLAERAQALLEANPVDSLAHADAVNDVVHLEDASHDRDALVFHLQHQHGIRTYGADQDSHDSLDALHRTLDHSDIADDEDDDSEPEPMDMSGGSGGSDNR